MTMGLFESMEKISPLTDEIKEAITKQVRVMTCPRYTHLVQIGKKNHHCYFIASGLVRIYYFKNGKEVNGTFLKEGEMLALAQSFYHKVPSRHGAETLETCKLFELSFEELEKLYWRFPLMMNNARLMAYHYNFYWRDRYELTNNQPVEDRYRELLLTHPDIVRRVRVTHLASYLDTTISHLSRIRKALAD